MSTMKRDHTCRNKSKLKNTCTCTNMTRRHYANVNVVAIVIAAMTLLENSSYDDTTGSFRVFVQVFDTGKSRVQSLSSRSSGCRKEMDSWGSNPSGGTYSIPVTNRSSEHRWSVSKMWNINTVEFKLCLFYLHFAAQAHTVCSLLPTPAGKQITIPSFPLLLFVPRSLLSPVPSVPILTLLTCLGYKTVHLVL